MPARVDKPAARRDPSEVSQQRAEPLGGKKKDVLVGSRFSDHLNAELVSRPSKHALDARNQYMGAFVELFRPEELECPGEAFGDTLLNEIAREEPG